MFHTRAAAPAAGVAAAYCAAADGVQTSELIHQRFVSRSVSPEGRQAGLSSLAKQEIL